ncbi:hypothetical protein [Alienimonas californiensis]|uniref:Uncharacterized protein n=1 Tax=Alienimonas californiensis TaxID=2527989 RepID=A0A517P6X0_9PLAN|nr:hypothetical protein [Alienimonas californiensis]QDT15113.1 hypothetical protein CA12_11940 [Alienimonas californiensis]
MSASPPPPPDGAPAGEGAAGGETAVVTMLGCPKCAAPLPVPAGRVRFLSCDHCGATVRLRRSHGRITAKRVRRLGRRVEGLSRAVRRMRIEEKLADLDDRWNRRRATLIDGWDERGKPQLPDRKLAVALTAVGAAAALYGAATSLLGGLFPFSLTFWGGLVVLAVGVPKWVRAERFRRGRENYRQARAALERRLSGSPSARDDTRHDARHDKARDDGPTGASR